MKVISLFSGAGGMDIGFKEAGFDVVIAVEMDSSCCNTLRKNNPELKVLEADVSKVTGEEILSMANLKRGEPALVIGGPPCQSFSLAGKRKGMEDGRGKLVLEFTRIVKEILPVAFVMENVKGMANWGNGRALEAIINEFESPVEFEDEYFQYVVKHHVLNGAHFGLPQFRERLFIVGNRTGVDYKFPNPTHGDPLEPNLFNTHEKIEKYETVWGAIGDLPPAEEPSDTAKRIAKTIKKRIETHGY